jgi:hypothetical protein
MMPTILNACKTVFSNDIRLLTAGFVAYGVTYAVNAVGCGLINEHADDVNQQERGRKASVIGMAATAVGYLTYSLFQSRLTVAPMDRAGQVVLAVQALLFYALARRIKVDVTENTRWASIKQSLLGAALIPLAGYASTKDAFKWAAGVGAIWGALQGPWKPSDNIAEAVAKAILPTLKKEYVIITQ